MRKRLYALAGAVIASAFFSVTTVKTISAEADTTPAVATTSSTAGSQPSTATSDASSAKQNTTDAVTNQVSSSTGSLSSSGNASGASSTQSAVPFSNSTGSVTSTSKSSSTDMSSTNNASSSSVTTPPEGKTNTDTSTVETPQTQTTPTDNTANSSTSSANSDSSSTPQPVTDNTSSGGGGPGDSSAGTAKPQSQTKVGSAEVTVDKANYFDNTDADPDNNKVFTKSTVTEPDVVDKQDFYTDKYYHGENNSANDPSKNSNAINAANKNPNDGAPDLGSYILDEQGKDGNKATNDEKAATLNTAFDLTYHDNDGHSVQPSQITLATGIDGHMTFNIEHDIWKYLVTGDTFTYQLPSGYKITEAQSGNIQNANSPDKGSTYGTYTIGTDGKITLTFFNPHTHDETGDTSVQSLEGQLSFKAKFNDQVITNPGQQGDKLHLPGQTDQDILVIHPATDQSISKTGRSDKNLDPNNIIWSVYMNKNMQTMTNATITEKFDDKVTYDNAKKPVEIYAIQVDLKGNVIKNDDGSDKLGEKLVAGTDYTVDAAGKVTFLKQITTPYELIYTTSINDAAKPKDTHGNIKTGDATLNNTVDQRDDEQGDNVLPASASVIAHYEGLFYKYDPAIATNDHPNDPDYDKLHHIYTWTVAYNHGTDTLNGNTGLYTDVIGAPQTFVKDSFHMWIMEYDPNNADQPFKYTNQQVDPSLYTLTPNADGSGFTVKFNDGFDKAVNMVYQTQITQGSKVISTDVKDIVNTAQVTGYDNQTPKPVTTHSYNLIKDVENGGPDRGLKVATWKLTINQSNYKMQDYVLVDTASNDGLSLPFDPDETLPNATNQPKVQLVDKTTGDTLVEGTDYFLTATGDQSTNATFTVVFIGKYKVTSDTFVLRYKTVYDVARVKTPLPNTNFSFTNDAAGTWTDVTTNNPVTDHAGNHFEASHDEAYQGSKNGVYNPETKQIHWTVISNYNAEDYKSYQLLDPIYQKQNFVPGSVKVTQGSIAAQGYFIPGETDPKYYTVHAYKGHVDMATGDFVIEGIINADGSITPMTGTTSYQGFQNYQGSELYNLRNYKDATTEIVIDFGSDATPLPKPSDVTGTDSRVKLAYQVEYDTDVKGILVDNMYNNIALTSYPIDNDGKLSVHGQASTYQGQPYISKTGNYNQDSGSNRANWTVDINRSQSAITNAVFTDTPTINQRIDPSTIHIYGVVAADLKTLETITKTVTDKDGKEVTKTFTQTKMTPDRNNELKQGIDYEVVLSHDTVTGQETLTIKFFHAISTAYVLEYQSKLYFSKDDQGQTVRFSNGATLNGDNVTPDQPGDENTDHFFVTESSAKAIGYFYNLVLTKQTTDGQKLAGISFNLYEENANHTRGALLRTGVTDENGVVTFKNIPGYHVDGVTPIEYFIQEVNPSADYITPDDLKNGTRTISVSMLSGTKNDQDRLGNIWNHLGQATLTKTDAAVKGSILNGAHFKLEVLKNGEWVTYSDAKGKAYDNLVTGVDGEKANDGKIVVNGLLPAQYRFVETQAPTDYILNDATPQTKEIQVPASDGNDPFGNEQRIAFFDTQSNSKGTFELHKVGTDGKAIAGAEFDLYYLDAAKKSVYVTNTKSDENGLVRFTGLNAGWTYCVREATSPNGYYNPDANADIVSFTINTNSADGLDNVKYTNPVDKTDHVINYTDHVVLTKVGNDNSKVVGATFILKDASGKVIKTLTTDTNGQIVIDNLTAGVYTLQESIAPAGYILNSTPQTFTISGIKDSTFYFTMTDYRGQIQITKVDGDNASKKLEGVVYTLTGNGSTQTATTDANGIATFKNLSSGDYTVVETQSLDGYIRDTKVYKFTISADVTSDDKSLYDLSATYKNYQNKVTFTKFLNSDKGTKGPNAVYELNGAGESKQFSTDVNGLIMFTGLKTGSYTLTELTAPMGYATNNTPLTFTVDADGNISVASLSQIDYQGHAQLTKTGANGPLQGVKFDLLDADQKTVEQANLITDANGVITTKDLKPGTYYFVEKQTLSGYILDATPIKVVVADRKGQNDAWLDDSAKATLINVQNKLVFTKYGTHVGNVLDGAEYTLVNSTTGEKTAFTFVNGQVSLSGLTAGTYTITEITAPKGYMLNPDVISFTVDEKGLINGKSELSLNQIDYQGYAFMKKVSADTKAPLAGAIFSVYNAEGKIVQTITTGVDGLVKTEFLPVGNYYFREMKAPDGYILNSNLVHFSINKSNHDVALDEGTFENWLGAVKMTKYGQPDVTNVGTRVMLPGTKFVLYYVVDDGSEELYGIDPNNEHNIHYFKAGEDTKGWTTVFTTNVNGQIFLQGLKPGNYYFKEVAHADGYILRDDTPDLQPELNKGLGSANFVDKPQGLEFSRVDGTSAVVDKNGHVISAPDGRDFSSRLYFVILPASDVESVAFAGDQTNYQGSMTFTKTNSKGDKLAGAVYQLLDSDKKAVEVTMDGKQVSQLTTDANGNFTITGLAPGTYYLKEITAPDGYLINGNVDETKFVIADTTRGGQSNVTASQIDYQGSIKLTKVAAEDGHVLANATFDLLDADKNVIKTGLTTDANGTLTVTDLKPGTYYFKETVAPTGYQLSTELLKVVVLDHATDEPVAVSAKFQDVQVPPVTPPTTPNIPNIPTTPTTPNVPNIPYTPTTPNVPNIPNVPTTPGQPNIPNVPTTPEVPNVPTTPTVPNVPVMPNVPNKPMTPTMPNQPARPAKPETPIVSAQNGSYVAVAVTPVASQKFVANGRPAGQPAKQEGHGVTGLPETGEKSASLLAMLGLVLLSVIAGFAYYVCKQEA